MTDRTEVESIRREMTKNINAVEGSREYLEAKHGQVWDTTELQQEFSVGGLPDTFSIYIGDIDVNSKKRRRNEPAKIVPKSLKKPRSSARTYYSKGVCRQMRC